MTDENSKAVTPDPKQIMNEQLRKTGLLRKMSAIFSRWFTTRDMCLELTKTLLDVIPGNCHETLLADMFRHAVDGWHKAGQKASDRDKYLAFVTGLLKEAPRIQEWCVYTQPKRGEMNVWDPLGTTLLDWLADQDRPYQVLRRDPEDTRPPVSDDDYRTVFGSRLLHTPDLFVINGQPIARVFGNTNDQLAV